MDIDLWEKECLSKKRLLKEEADRIINKEKKIHLYKYHCGCGYWHLTHQADRKGRNRVLTVVTLPPKRKFKILKVVGDGK